MISHGSQAAGRDGAARVMTICNTGALATAGWGTALGVLRTLHARGAFGARRESCPFWKLCKKGGKWDMMGLEIFEHLHILELSIHFLALCSITSIGSLEHKTRLYCLRCAFISMFTSIHIHITKASLN